MILARFDLCSYPESLDKSEEKEWLRWMLKVHSWDTLAVVEDREKEKAVKLSREQSEPGRAEKCKDIPILRRF